MTWVGLLRLGFREPRWAACVVLVALEEDIEDSGLLFKKDCGKIYII